MNTIKISEESLQSFQHDKNVVENQLPDPPALVVLDGDTTKSYSRNDLISISNKLESLVLSLKEMEKDVAPIAYALYNYALGKLMCLSNEFDLQTEDARK